MGRQKPRQHKVTILVVSAGLNYPRFLNHHLWRQWAADVWDTPGALLSELPQISEWEQEHHLWRQWTADPWDTPGAVKSEAGRSAERTCFFLGKALSNNQHCKFVGIGAQNLLHHHVHLSSWSPTTISSIILTTLYRENTPTTSRLHNMPSKSPLNSEVQFSIL